MLPMCKAIENFFPNTGRWNFMCYQDATWWCLLCYQGARLESTRAAPDQMHSCRTRTDAVCDLRRDCMWASAFFFFFFCFLFFFRFSGLIVMKMKPTIVMKFIYLFCAFVHIYRIINHFSLCLCLHSTYYYRSFSFVPLFM